MLTGQCDRRCVSSSLPFARNYTNGFSVDLCRALFDFNIPMCSDYVLFGLDPSVCYGSTTTNEDVNDDNEPLLLKSALDGAYERMRLRGGLPPHINVASLHRLLMPGSGVPPPYRRFGWSISSRRYHHRHRRYSRRCRHSIADAATIDEDYDEGIPCLTTDFVSRLPYLDSRRSLFSFTT